MACMWVGIPLCVYGDNFVEVGLSFYSYLLHSRARAQVARLAQQTLLPPKPSCLLYNTNFNDIFYLGYAVLAEHP